MAKAKKKKAVRKCKKRLTIIQINKKVKRSASIKSLDKRIRSKASELKSLKRKRQSEFKKKQRSAISKNK
jgi:hypothetical protein